ncbi:unnamed protein product, partial [Tenebrio molitor]
TDECFPVIYLIFVKFGYHKITKMFNLWCIFFHSIFYVLQVYYIIIKFNQSFLMKHLFVMTMFLYMIYAMIYLAICEKSYNEQSSSFHKFAWSIDSAGLKAKQTILDKAAMSNMINYISLLLAVFSVVINLPIWGKERELFLSVEVFEYIFGKWSKIPYTIYFATVPYLAYATFRLSFMLLYCILQIQIQIFLVNEQILQISDNFTDLNNWDIIDDLSYQNTMHQRLSQNCRQHYEIKRLITILYQVVESATPFILGIGVLLTISLFFFILDNFFSMSNMLKIRIFTLLICNIFMITVFCKAGQDIFEETERIFDALGTCPWYIWNIRNRRTLLIFMANSIEPFSFYFVGITIDYRLAVNVIRTAVSYALVLRSLNEVGQ